MAFITIRRSRNTSSYYLVESYRDEQGRSRKRTLCYLGREQDGTDTLAKALGHWEKIAEEANRLLKSARGKRLRILQDRIDKARQRIALLHEQLENPSRIEAERRRRAEETEHWNAIQRLHQNPTEENAHAAKRAFRFLSLRYHPDQGGSHEEFIHLKSIYDRATARYRRAA